MQRTVGKIDLSKALEEAETDDERSRIRGLIATEKRKREDLDRQMSPPGGLGLPQHLDERRIEFDIPDGAFRCQPTFDRILVWQIPDFDGDTLHEGSKVIVTPSRRAREKFETPKGVLVAAGLSAMDSLISNGYQLGDVVDIIELAPYRRRVGWVGGQPVHCLVMRAGDLVGSEDLAEKLRSKELRMVETSYEEGGVEVRRHVYETKDGAQLSANDPFIREDK